MPQSLKNPNKSPFADTLCVMIALGYSVYLGYLAALGAGNLLITLVVLFVVWLVANFVNYCLIYPALTAFLQLKTTPKPK